MYYDQLLVLKQHLETVFVNIVNDRTVDFESKIPELEEIIAKKKVVEKRLKYAKMRYYESAKKEEAKQFKKAIKHEFLTQAMAGYDIDSIVQFIYENYNNPGINLEKLIEALRNNGYFNYTNPLDESSSLHITDKALRYLENDANVSLKR